MVLPRILALLHPRGHFPRLLLPFLIICVEYAVRIRSMRGKCVYILSSPCCRLFNLKLFGVVTAAIAPSGRTYYTSQDVEIDASPHLQARWNQPTDAGAISEKQQGLQEQCVIDQMALFFPF